MLLSMWLSQCPLATSAFLNVPGSVSYLVTQVCSNEHDDNEYLLQGMCAFLIALCVQFNDDSVESYTKEGLKQLLTKRIGLETFVAKLGEVSKHEMYSRAAKQPQIRAKSMGELLLDYEFCKLFKVLESEFINYCFGVGFDYNLIICTQVSLYPH
jgi:Uso1 / p115 like vesicle tethering protein, head region